MAKVLAILLALPKHQHTSHAPKALSCRISEESYLPAIKHSKEKAPISRWKAPQRAAEEKLSKVTSFSVKGVGYDPPPVSSRQGPGQAWIEELNMIEPTSHSELCLHPNPVRFAREHIPFCLA